MAKLTTDYVEDVIDDIRHWDLVDVMALDFYGGYKKIFVHKRDKDCFKIVTGNKVKRIRYDSRTTNTIEDVLSVYNSIQGQDVDDAGQIINVVHTVE